MSYYIQTCADDMEQFASISGYGALIKWAQSLPHSKVDELRHLFRYGWSQEPAEVQSQLEAAIKNKPPTDPSVLETANGLLEILKKSPNCTVLTITDGTGTGAVENDAN
jgi:hypothetical protein